MKNDNYREWAFAEWHIHESVNGQIVAGVADEVTRKS